MPITATRAFLLVGKIKPTISPTHNGRYSAIKHSIGRFSFQFITSVRVLAGRAKHFSEFSGSRAKELLQSQLLSRLHIMDQAINFQEATIGSGCFWCVEAVFQQLEGVERVESGYTGGHIENPSYEAVCQGTTGHAEVARIVFDPNKLTFPELLEVFWQTHDPTTLNRQGNDVGTQYRSAIFYHTDEQREQAETYKAQLDTSGTWPKPIVTEISPLERYYPAENYHQNYFNNNPDKGYCAFVVRPKVEKFRKQFTDRLKS